MRIVNLRLSAVFQHVQIMHALNFAIDQILPAPYGNEVSRTGVHVSVCGVTVIQCQNAEVILLCG